MFVLLTLVLLLLKNVFPVLGNSQVDLDSYQPARSFTISNGAVAKDYAGDYKFNRGDFNGDGFDDLLLVDRYVQTLYILYGKESLSDIVLDKSNWNFANGQYFDIVYDARVSIIFIGDFNNDGFDDVMISYPDCTPPRSSEGAGCSYIITGQATPYATTRYNFIASVFIFGADVYESTGNSLTPAGDINGDGFDDVVIDTGTSKTYLVYGRAATYQTIDLASFTASDGVYWTDLRSDAAPAGDFNHDGFDDFLYRFPSYASPEVDLMFGQTNFPVFISTSQLDSQPRVIFNSSDFCQSLVPWAAGDINNDGFEDIAIIATINSGDPFSTPPVPYEGMIYLVYGKSLASNSVTSINLATLSPTEGIKIPINRPCYNLGSMGNANFDAYNDFYFSLSLPLTTNYQAYILYGGSSLNATFDLTKLTPKDGLMIDYDDYGAFRVVGDVDKDGQTEYAITSDASYSSDAFTYLNKLSNGPPTRAPTLTPTAVPTTAIPTRAPTPAVPTISPTFVPTRAPTTAVAADTDGASDSNDSSSALSTGGIIGIAIGGAAALVVVIAGVAYFIAGGMATSPSVPTNASSSQGAKSDYSSVQQKESSDIEMNPSKEVAVVSSEAEMRF